MQESQDPIIRFFSQNSLQTDKNSSGETQQVGVCQDKRIHVSVTDLEAREIIVLFINDMLGKHNCPTKDYHQFKIFLSSHSG